LNDGGWDRATGVDELRPFIFDAFAAKSNRADFNDGVASGIQAGGLEVEGD
jgi:hypothetical protein